MGKNGKFHFWVAQPFGLADISLLKACAGLAEPLLDLRYGEPDEGRRLVRSTLEAGLGCVTCTARAADAEMLDFLRRTLPTDARVVLGGPFDTETALVSALAELKSAGLLAGMEADGGRAARTALKTGADFVLASGCEAAGFTSARTTFVLTQELLAELDLPVVVRGSVGPRGAGALYAAGCSGCVLDTQVLLAPESPIDPDLAQRLREASATDTVLVGDLVGRPYRGLATTGPDRMAELRNRERQLFADTEDVEEQAERFHDALGPLARGGLAGGLKPVGQGIEFARRFAERGLDAREIILDYRRGVARTVARVRRHWPFQAGSSLARCHGTELPIVQGPMAVITDGPGLAPEVARHGALPYVAAAGMDGPAVRELVSSSRAALDGAPFGVGVLAFDDEGAVSGALLDERPTAVTVAGGSPPDVLPFQEAGIPAYLHTPTPAHMRGALDAGVHGLILEGHEAGGHVGSIGSLVLWELAVNELLARSEDTLGQVRVLFAGGLATERSAAMAAVFAAPLAELGAGVGLQVGTAYLLTEEAVRSGVIGDAYRHALQMAEETAVSGRLLNLPARWTRPGGFRRLFEREAQIAASDAPLPEKKRRYERLVRELLEASVGRRGLDHSPPHMCGQVIGCARNLLHVEELHERLTAGGSRLAARLQLPQEGDEDFRDAVAVVGMGCVFPGAANPGDFWQNICDGVSAVGEVPPDRWALEVYYDATHQTPDKSASRLGAFIRDFQKDPLRFHIPPVAADSIDRGQFLALEVARQALEDAGCLERDFPRERTGVVLGNSMGGELSVDYGMRILRHRFAADMRSTPAFQKLPEDVREMLVEQAMEAAVAGRPELTEDSCAGTLGSVFAGRICNHFNLGGVSFTLDGACASSLAAVNAGIQGLHSGQFDLVLAGGVETRMDPATYVMFSSLGVLSDTGAFPFDERADGFVMGEGVGMVVLKRYPDAVRDGDRIYAVIRAVGSSSDGSARSVTAPHVPGQVQAMRRAYQGAPFTPGDIGLVEAHGTGTRTGDPTELSSLTQVFGPYVERRRSVALGSVKSMVGHMKTAAGIGGLIKVALAVHHGLLPPTMNCEQPRNDYDWESSPFYLITEPSPWPDDGLPLRGAVNAFGFGGVNFHVVLEEPPRVTAEAPAAPAGQSRLPSELFLFRAPERRQMLEQIADAEAEAAADSGQALASLARQVWERCGHGRCSLAVLARDARHLGSKLHFARQTLADPDRSEITSAQGVYYGEDPLADGARTAFLFPGQGSQYVGMGGDLLDVFPFLGPVVEDVAAVARRWTGHDILPVIFPNGKPGEEELEELKENLVRTDYNHPALLAMWCAIDLFLRRAGIRPHMAAGHSVGEYGALHAAGIFGLEATGAVTCVRGARAYEQCHRSGSMAAVAAPADAVEDVLRDVQGLVVVANKNCRMQSVISGETAAVDRSLELFEKRGYRCRRLRVSSAFHTDLMSPCVGPFREALEYLPVRRPEIPVQCNLTGTAYRADGNFAEELRDALARHLVSPVEFMANVESLYAAGVRLFLEVGPGSVLCSFTDNILGERPHWSFATNVRGVSPAAQLLHALAYCFARGLHVDLPAVLPHWRRGLKTSHQPIPAVRTGGESKETRRGASQASDPFAAALQDAPREAVERYLATRRPFLQEMLENIARLDFRDFAESVAAPDEDNDDPLCSEVIDVFARRTGYPPDAIDLDLDLEAELGLDSIKRTEILNELEGRFGVELGSSPEMRTREHLSTVRGVVRVVRETLSGGESTTPVVEPPAADETEWRTDCHRLVCELREVGPPAAADEGRLAGRKVALLTAAGAPTEALKARLISSGASVMTVAMDDDGLPEHPDVVVDLCGWARQSGATPGECEDWQRVFDRRSRKLLALAQEIVQTLKERREKCLWVEATPLGGDLGATAVEAPHALSAVGLALSRCMFSDHPDLFDVLYIDFEPETDPAEVAARVVAEMSAAPSHPEIGYVDGRRHEIHWVPADRAPSDQPPLKEGSVVLAVGGARGITAAMCRELAGRAKVHFIVVGRSEVDLTAADPAEPESFETERAALIRELRASDGRVVPAEVDRAAWRRVWDQERRHNLALLRRMAAGVEYRRCDVTDAAAVQQLVREIIKRFGCIDLVVSGAGSLVEKRIEELEPDRFIAGLRPKAIGTANLLAALGDAEVDTFVNVSSIVGRWGHMGMASYSVGHETASLLTAAARADREGRWLNLVYGPWLNVGMTRVGEIIERVRLSGGSFVREAHGVEYFIAELQATESETTSFRGEEPFGVLLAGGGATDPHPLLDTVEVTGDDTARGVSVFDPKGDPLARDHRVAGEALLPGAAAVEMMAEAAGVLADPRKALVEVRDVRLLRPMRFPRGEPRRFNTLAVRTDARGENEAFECEVFTMFRPPHGGDAERVSHATCVAVFGTRRPPPEPSLLVVRHALGDHAVEMDAFWDTRLARGRRGGFRNIRAIQSVAVDSIVGDVFGPPGSAASQDRFTGDCLRLDGVLYLASLPDVFATANPAHYVESIESIRFYERDLPSTARRCRSRIGDWQGRRFSNEIEGVDALGVVRERIRRAISVRAEKPDRTEAERPIFEDLRWHPQRREIAQRLGLATRLSLTEVEIPLVMNALEATGEGDFLDEWLSERERELFEGLTHPKRRSEWLAGRICAKEAVRSLRGDTVAAAELEVLPDAQGAPALRARDAGKTPRISIAHSQGLAVAAALESAPVGIDVEKVAFDIHRFQSRFCTADEVRSTRESTGELEVPTLMNLWVAKEAALKTAGGSSLTMTNLRVRTARLDGRYIVVDLDSEAGLAVRAVCLRSHNCFYAVATQTRDAP